MDVVSRFCLGRKIFFGRSIIGDAPPQKTPGGGAAPSRPCAPSPAPVDIVTEGWLVQRYIIGYGNKVALVPKGFSIKGLCFIPESLIRRAAGSRGNWGG